MRKFSKEENREINDLIRKKEYDIVYYKYGSEAYINYVPSKIRKEEIKNLLNQRRFMDIYNKFGENEFNKYKKGIMKIDKYYEKNSKEKSLAVIKVGKISKIFKRIFSFFVVTPAIVPGIAMAVNENLSNKSLEENLSIVEEYNKHIEEYTNSLNDFVKNANKNSIEINDLDIIMKVMQDTWNEMLGYKKPINEIFGQKGINIYRDGYGVCRNISSDFVEKINSFNPKYNARCFSCNVENLNNIKISNVLNITNLEKNETTINENPSQDEQEKVLNHSIVALEIEREGKIYNLFVDPTNPSIGVYKNGEIQFFDNQIVDFSVGNLKNALIYKPVTEGFDAIKNTSIFFESFNVTDEEYEKLNKEFGYENQNISLEKNKKMEEKNKKSDFKSSIVECVVNNGEKIEFSISTKNEKICDIEER